MTVGSGGKQEATRGPDRCDGRWPPRSVSPRPCRKPMQGRIRDERKQRPAQYDDLAGHGGDPRGTFAMLPGCPGPRRAGPGHPRAVAWRGAGGSRRTSPGLGYRLAGVDLARTALVQAAGHAEARPGKATAPSLADASPMLSSAPVYASRETPPCAARAPRWPGRCARGGLLASAPRRPPPCPAGWSSRRPRGFPAPGPPASGLRDPRPTEGPGWPGRPARGPGSARPGRAPPLAGAGAALARRNTPAGRDGPHLVHRRALPGPRRQETPCVSAISYNPPHNANPGAAVPRGRSAQGHRATLLPFRLDRAARGSRTYTNWPCACLMSRSGTDRTAIRSTRSGANPSSSSVTLVRTLPIPAPASATRT